MKIKVSEATPAQLDWMVAHALGLTAGRFCGLGGYSTDWAQGGPIIDAYDIDVMRNEDVSQPEPMAARTGSMIQHPTRNAKVWIAQRGSTKLIAAMRCFVASRLGEEVDVSEELL